MTKDIRGRPLPAPPAPPAGRWTVDTLTWRIHWSRQARLIHEAATSLPTVWEALDFIDPAYRPDLFARVLACVREARPFEAVVALTTSRGARKRVRITGFPGISSPGGHATAHGTVTELPGPVAGPKEKVHEDLHAALRDWELFGQAIPHELRSRVGIIDGYAKAIAAAGEPLSARSRQHLDRLSAVSGHLGALLEGVLAFAPLGTRELDLRQVDLAQLARESLAVRQLAEPDRNVTVLVTGDLVVRGDPGLLRLVMDNLVGNAWKFTRSVPEARIEVRAEPNEGHRVYAVEDNGAGFDMADAPRLFTPFTRLHPKQDFEGSGIGLAIVRRAVERHGGSVWACSAPGRGASFLFDLGPAT